MRLLEAIMAGDQNVFGVAADQRLEREEIKDGLPLVVLSCIDPRLNQLIPRLLGLPELDLIWLRNAGNVILESASGAARSIALACAIKRGREIAIIGHSDCRVRATSVNDLLNSFKSIGIERSNLPDNLVESFGLFASERQNVISGVEVLRRSPLIGPRVPIHGLLLDIKTERLECLVNGYNS
jgi:carbonic anhydrase